MPGVEVGGSVGAAPVSGPVSFAAPSFEEAHSLGSLANFGPKFESLSYSPIDAPIAKGEVANMVPYKLGMFDPAGEIRFNPELLNVESVSNSVSSVLEPLTPASAVAEAEFVLAQPGALVTADLDVNPVAHLQPEVRLADKGGDTEAAVLASVPQQELVEEIVEQDLVENRISDNKQSLEELEIEEEWLRYVEDEEVSDQRRQVIREALEKAKLEADRLGLKGISGLQIARFLPPEYEGIRSQIVKKDGPDGSYQETIEAISSIGEFDSQVAQERFDMVVSEKKPVKKAKEGNDVSKEDVGRVLKYRIFKPVKAHEVFVTRITKKKVPLNQVIVETKEPTLEDYPDLAETLAPKQAA